MNELNSLVLLVKDAVDELSDWSVNNDDEYNEEIDQLYKIIAKLEDK